MTTSANSATARTDTVHRVGFEPGDSVPGPPGAGLGAPRRGRVFIGSNLTNHPSGGREPSRGRPPHDGRAPALRYPLLVQRLTAFGKRVLPGRFVHWYRRRRATRRYMQALGYEVYDRQVRMDLEDIEGRVIARREGFQEQVLKDVLARTDLI